MKTYDVKQGSGEWLKLRLGIPTASEFDALISPEWKIRTGQGPTAYLYKKVCEKVLGFSSDQGGSFHMQQGTILEHEAIPWLEFTHEIKVTRVGFVTTDDGRFGCSPDGLIGDDSGIEVKCPSPEVHLRYLMENKLPPEYRAQVYGSMTITGRSSWKFLSYSRQFPALLLTIARDAEIEAKILEALEGFSLSFEAKLAMIKAMKDEENQLQARLHPNVP